MKKNIIPCIMPVFLVFGMQTCVPAAETGTAYADTGITRVTVPGTFMSSISLVLFGGSAHFCYNTLPSRCTYFHLTCES